jgi:ribosomal protein L29
LKTPGKINRLLSELERLEAEIDDYSPKQLKAALRSARHELEAIRADLSSGAVSSPKCNSAA